MNLFAQNWVGILTIIGLACPAYARSLSVPPPSRSLCRSLSPTSRHTALVRVFPTLLRHCPWKPCHRRMILFRRRRQFPLSQT